MLTVFAVVQVGINLALIAVAFFLLREREALARAAVAREESLEALAAEFCALGRELLEGAAPTPTPPGAARASLPAPGGCDTAFSARAAREITAEGLVPASRSEERSPVTSLAVPAALPDGEAELLRKLRRARSRGAAGRRVRPSGGRQIEGGMASTAEQVPSRGARPRSVGTA